MRQTIVCCTGRRFTAVAGAASSATSYAEVVGFADWAHALNVTLVKQMLVNLRDRFNNPVNDSVAYSNITVSGMQGRGGWVDNGLQRLQFRY